MNFKIGQRVVCVDPPTIQRGDEILPIAGRIYTIRGFLGESICLVEIVNNPHQYNDSYGEVHFKAYRFRPLLYENATKEILAKFPLTEEKCDVATKEVEIQKV